MNENWMSVAGQKILVVDDVPANLDVLYKTLEPEGYTIQAAPSGEIALRLVTQTPPNLILLDVMMPGIDGFETCRRLRKLSNNPALPIIMITAMSDPTVSESRHQTRSERHHPSRDQDTATAYRWIQDCRA